MTEDKPTNLNDDSEPAVDLGSITILIGPSRQGDVLAREQLLQEMKDYLERTAHRHMDATLKQKVGASDIVQQSFLQVIENFEQFRGDSAAEFRGWLKKIVVNEMNRVRRVYRTEKRDVTRERSVEPHTSTAPGTTPADDQRTPSSEAIHLERMEKFHAVLKEMPEDHAQVVRLRNIERLPFREIGEIMGRSEDAVSKLWYRAMLKFEEKLKGSGHFESE